MHEPALLAEPDRRVAVAMAPVPDLVDSVRELVRSGYAIDPDAEADGLLLRHKVGPDLVLKADGTIALALSQPARKGWRAGGGDSPRRISWRRTFVVAFVAMVAWSLSVLLGVTLLSG